MTNKLLFFLFISLASIHTLAQTDNGPYILQNSHIHTLDSTIVDGQTYEIRIALPGGYDPADSRTYPVLYVLDGQWNFTIIADISGKLIYDGDMPPAIIAAITWGGEGDDPNVLRFRDFLRPVIPELPMSGGAERFLHALTEELVPFVENHYRADGQRVLTGSSLGGLFTTYAMLEKPGFFTGYIANAGSYFADFQYLADKIGSVADSDALAGVRSYLAAGRLDDNTAGVEAINNLLTSVAPRQFSNRFKSIEGLGHAGSEPVAYTYGLQYVFRAPFVPIKREVLERYAGVFKGTTGEGGMVSLEVSVFDRGILEIGNGLFYAESETRFNLRGIDIYVEFTHENEMILYQQDRPTLLTRAQ